MYCSVTFLVMVSRYATCGSPMVPSTPNSVRMRSKRHLQVQLAHAAQNGLAGLAVGLQMQRGIGAHHLAERGAEFLLFRLGLGLHRHTDDRVREAHALQHHRICGVAQRIAGFGIGQRHQRNDVAGARFLDRIGLLGEHLDHAADLLALAARGVLHRGALGQHARIHADEGQRAIDVVDDFESQRRERLIVRALALADGLAVGVDGLDGATSVGAGR